MQKKIKVHNTKSTGDGRKITGFKSKYRFDISDIYLFTRLTLRKVNELFFLRSNEVILP